MTSSLPARLVAYAIVGILVVPGPVLLLVAAGTGIERWVFIRSSASADGVIVALARMPGSTKKSVAPVFRFSTRSDVTVTVTSNIYEAPSVWQAGVHVRVLYEEDRPENAHIDSFWQLWMPQFVLGIVGSGLSCIPLMIYLGRRRAAAASRLIGGSG